MRPSPTAAPPRNNGRTCSATPSSWPPRRRRGGRSTWTGKTRRCATATAGIPLGQNLLLARRLVESGVGFVTVNGWTGKAPDEKLGGPPASSWDMHGSNMGMGNAFGTGSYGMGWCLPRLDEALSALLADLEDRGLLESTLVVCMGEFGRTPNIINGQFPGRQHWPQCWSAILAGGGIRGGQVYGESDKTGSCVKDRPVRPQDLSATIYHALGVPLDPRLGKDGVSQPLTTGTPLVDLFG